MSSEVRLRVEKVFAERLPHWAHSWRFDDGMLSIGYVQFTAADLRALANAIDLGEDATRAMIHDLQEESAAYQKGLEQGRKEFFSNLKPGTTLVIGEDGVPMWNALVKEGWQ